MINVLVYKILEKDINYPYRIAIHAHMMTIVDLR